MSAETHDASHTHTLTVQGVTFCVNCMFTLTDDERVGFELIPLKRIEYMLDVPCWEFALTARTLLLRPDLSEAHTKRIAESNPMLWPMIVAHSKDLREICGTPCVFNQLEVVDGMHRLARLAQLEKTHAFVYVFPKEVLEQTIVH